MTRDGPGASGHTHTASPATDCGGVTASAAPGKQWRCKWGAQGEVEVKAELVVKMD